MAEGLNKVMLIGNLGQTPELRFTQSGQPVLSLRLATNERFKNREGEWDSRAEWHSIVIWGKRGESLSRVLSKGSQMYIEGRLQTRSWEDRQGQKRYTTEVVANTVILLGRRGGGGGGGSDDRPPLPNEQDMEGYGGFDDGGGSDSGGGGDQGGGGGGGSKDFSDDDIPF